MSGGVPATAVAAAGIRRKAGARLAEWGAAAKVSRTRFATTLKRELKGAPIPCALTRPLLFAMTRGVYREGEHEMRPQPRNTPIHHKVLYGCFCASNNPLRLFAGSPWRIWLDATAEGCRARPTLHSLLRACSYVQPRV